MDGWTFRDELQCGVVQVEVTYFRKSSTRRGEISSKIIVVAAINLVDQTGCFAVIVRRRTNSSLS